MSKILDTKDCEELGKFLLGDARHPRTRKLCDILQGYIGGMDDAQRDVFIEEWLSWVWEHRHSFNPQYEGLMEFCRRGMRAAAECREKWLISVPGVLPGVWEKRWILGRRLGRHK